MPSFPAFQLAFTPTVGTLLTFRTFFQFFEELPAPVTGIQARLARFPVTVVAIVLLGYARGVGNAPRVLQPVPQTGTAYTRRTHTDPCATISGPRLGIGTLR